MGCPGVSRQVRNQPGVRHRHLPAPPPPPRDVRVQRGADHPRCRRWMPADRPPRRPRTGKGLVHDVLRHVLVADTNQDRTQTSIPGPLVELGEVRSLVSHTYLTHNPRPRPTCLMRHLPESAATPASTVLRGVILDRLATGDVRTDQALKRSVQLVESRAYQVDAGGIIQTGLGGLPRLLQQRPRASFPPLARAAGSNGHDEATAWMLQNGAGQGRAPRARTRICRP